MSPQQKHPSLHNSLLAGLLLTAGSVAAAPFSDLVPLQSEAECSRCVNYLLPGIFEPSPETVWTVHSDLPELFTSEGVLYTTRPILPAFKLNDGSDKPAAMRQQVNNGFEALDDDFELFFFHTTRVPSGSPGRRIVVFVENIGAEPTTIRPRQAITTDGLIGTVHEMENGLARRVMSHDWDTPLSSVTIPPGDGVVIAASKQFAARNNSADSSTNVNCFGIVQGFVEKGASPAKLQLSVIAIPGGESLGQSTVRAKELLNTGANSGEAAIDLSTPPQGCQVRRATGVFRSFRWVSHPMRLDVTALPENRVAFQMALPAIQSGGCMEAQQTAPLILHPPTTRPDTVGNYHTEYLVSFELVNPSDAARTADIRFGKTDADVGLAWQAKIANAPIDEDELKGLPVQTGWAGPKQTADMPDDTRSLFGDPRGTISVPARSSVHVGMRFMIVGNSSLPFQLHVVGE
jgi:hypothetical protein